VSAAISLLLSQSRMSAGVKKEADPSRMAFIAAHGKPARISIAIMNCGTLVSRVAAAPPATISGDQPRLMRRVRIASSAQTRR
jgi:hypothetical protein